MATKTASAPLHDPTGVSRSVIQPCFLGAVLAWLTPALAQAQSDPAAGFDIAGVRLGMTEGEACAALQAFDPALRVAAVMGVFNYRDGTRMLTTPEYLDWLEAMKGNSEGVKVYFSGPVGDVRVIGVYRNALVTANPPSAAQFAQSLIGKYGRPSGINGEIRLERKRGCPAALCRATFA